MVVVPFLTTVHSSRSSAIDPQTCSPTGQRGCWCPGVDYILTQGPEPAGQRPLPTWGCHSRGLVFLFGEWVWQGRRLEEASYLVISRWGEQLELGGLASPSHNRFRNHPLASGVWVLECSLLSLPSPRPVSLRCGIQLGAANLTLAPQSFVRGWVLPRERSFSQGPFWGATCRELSVLRAFWPPG